MAVPEEVPVRGKVKRSSRVSRLFRRRKQTERKTERPEVRGFQVYQRRPAHPRLSFYAFGWLYGLHRFVVLIRIAASWGLGLLLGRFLGLLAVPFGAVVAHHFLELLFCRGRRRRRRVLFLLLFLALVVLVKDYQLPKLSVGRSGLIGGAVLFPLWLLLWNAEGGFVGAVGTSMIAALLGGRPSIFLVSFVVAVVIAPLAKRLTRLRGPTWLARGAWHPQELAAARTLRLWSTLDDMDPDKDDEPLSNADSEQHNDDVPLTQTNPVTASVDSHHINHHSNGNGRPTAESFFSLHNTDLSRRPWQQRSLIAQYEPRRR